MLALVHVSPAVTIPFALVIMVILAWYWRRLGGEATSPRRRNIRRFATVLMLITVPVLVLGLSIYDPVVNRSGYIMPWSAAMGLILLLILCAGIDVINNMRQYDRHLRGEIVNSLHQLPHEPDDAANPVDESVVKGKNS